jgi:hypothetical protein
MTLRMRGLSVIIAATLLAFSTSANAQFRLDYGIVTSIQFLQNDPGQNIYGLQKLKDLGVGSVRIGIDWKVVQPQQNGAFDFWFTDQMISNAMANGIDVFANLGEPPSWAAACTVCVPYDLWAWKAYVRAVIDHYAFYGHRITYGVWNEPNDTTFLKTSPGQANSQDADVNVYLPLVNFAIAARNESGTGARFALPDSTPHAWNNTNWFIQFYAAVGPSMAGQDLIAVHWYPNNGNFTNYLTGVINHTGRELWLTEWGPATPTSDSAQVTNIASVLAAYDNRSGAMWNWKRHFYYRLWDGQTNKEAILYANWTQRPGFNTYKVQMPIMTAGWTLGINQEWASDGNQIALKYQNDGNLVLYQNGTFPIWNSGTFGTAPGYAIMQTDGNFVVYDGFGTPVFHTGTFGNPGAYLAIQHDGNLVVYSITNTPLWATMTFWP